jgi:hypothetical protein
MRCCSFSISPQAHKSLGRPQVGQISAMMLNGSKGIELFKTFKHSSAR